MYLKEFELENIKAIKNFKGVFEGEVYLVTGENEVGKSTILQMLAMALSGQRDDVLNNKSKKGFMKAIVGDDGKNYEINLKCTEANPKGILSITDKETGMRSDKVSTIQDIFGYTDFDASEFVSWSKTKQGRRKQIEIIKSLLPKDVQGKILSLDGKIQEAYDSRADLNSELKVYSNLLGEKGKNIQDGDVDTYADEIPMIDLIEKKTETATLIEQHKGVKDRFEEREVRKNQIPDDVKSIQVVLDSDSKDFDSQELKAKEAYDKALAEIKKSRKEAVEKAAQDKKQLLDEEKEIAEKQKKAKKWLKDNEPETLDSIQLEIEEAEKHNKKHAIVKEYLTAKETFLSSEKKRDDKGKELEELRETRETIIKESNIPVEGLSFSDDGLTLNGIPFEHDKISTSQEMEAVVKVIIAKNPKTKIFRVGQGESLGGDRLKAIVDFAKKNGCQGFIENVVRGQKDLIVHKYTEK